MRFLNVSLLPGSGPQCWAFPQHKQRKEPHAPPSKIQAPYVNPKPFQNSSSIDIPVRLYTHVNRLCICLFQTRQIHGSICLDLDWMGSSWKLHIMLSNIRAPQSLLCTLEASAGQTATDPKARTLLAWFRHPVRKALAGMPCKRTQQ